MPLKIELIGKSKLINKSKLIVSICLLKHITDYEYYKNKKR